MSTSSQIPQLRFQEGTEQIWQKLRNIPRTGWVMWEIPNPENVAEHILSIRELAFGWKSELSLSEEDFLDLLNIIEVHDWPEVVTGDIVIMGDEVNAEDLQKTKKISEREAMVKICANIPEGDVALAYYIRYEEALDYPACLAKQLDKLQAVSVAAAYEKKYNRPGLLAEFVTYSKARIDIPFLKNKLDEYILA